MVSKLSLLLLLSAPMQMLAMETQSSNAEAQQFIPNDYTWIKEINSKKWKQVPVPVTKPEIDEEESLELSSLYSSVVVNNSDQAAQKLQEKLNTVESKKIAIKKELESLDAAKEHNRKIALLALPAYRNFMKRHDMTEINILERKLQQKARQDYFIMDTFVEEQKLDQKQSELDLSRRQQEQQDTIKQTIKPTSWNLLAWLFRSK